MVSLRTSTLMIRRY